MKKRKLIGYFILEMLGPIAKLVSCILIGVFVSGSIWIKILYMILANVAIICVEVGIGKIHDLKQRLKNKKEFQNLQNTDGYQQDNIRDIVRDVTYAKELESNHIIEVDTCIEYSDTQINSVLTSSDIQLEDYTFIMLYQIEQNQLKDAIAVTTNKEKLRELKQELIKVQFQLQDVLARYHNLRLHETEFKSFRKQR